MTSPKNLARTLPSRSIKIDFEYETMVTIPMKEYDELLDCQELLKELQDYEMDNWEDADEYHERSAD